MQNLYPLVLADIALFTVQERELKVLLVRRANSPQKGRWALPGGILKPEIDKSLDATAQRVLREKAGVTVRVLRQVGMFSGADRDPRGWSVTALYYALLPSDLVQAVAGPKAEEIAWVSVQATAGTLAFDHHDLLKSAVTKIRNKVERKSLPLHLMKPQFTLSELQASCEAILGRPVDKSVFRRRLKAEKALQIVSGAFVGGAQRPAQLYSADQNYDF